MWQNFTAVGRLTKDVERKVTTTNKSVADFSIAVNSGKDIVDFIDIQVWDKTAEFLATNGKKGLIIFVTGTLKSNSYTNKTSGQNVTRKYILANRVELVGKQETHNEPSSETETQDPFASQTKVEDDPFVSSTNQFKDTSDMPF